jgi:hypothetical protein
MVRRLSHKNAVLPTRRETGQIDETYACSQSPARACVLTWAPTHCRRLHLIEVLFLWKRDAYTKTRMHVQNDVRTCEPSGLCSRGKPRPPAPNRHVSRLHLNARRKVELVSSVGDPAKEVTGLEEQSKGSDDTWVPPAAHLTPPPPLRSPVWSLAPACLKLERSLVQPLEHAAWIK